MLRRRPSLTTTYDWCYAKDPALEQPSDEMTPEQLKALAKRHQVARETGAWTSITRAGENPTRFVVRPLHGKLVRRVRDLVAMGKLGESESRALLVQLALTDIAGEDFDVELVDHPTWGKLAPDSLITELDAIDPGIVTDLSDEILRRSSSPGPLS